MVRLASEVAEFEICDLSTHHLTDKEKKVLRHHVEDLGYVTSALIENDVLFVRADFGKLSGEAGRQAYAMLKSRATAQVQRCKGMRVVRRLVHS